MKTVKKALVLILAVALCILAAMPALAAGGDGTEPKTATVSIAGVTGHTYSVYQIFTGDVAADGENVYLSNAKYGQNYVPEGKTLGGTVPEADLALITDAEAFANQLVTAGNLGEPFGTLTEAAEWKLTVPTGYYLVTDSVTGDAENTNISAYIVQIAADITLTPKTTTPTLDKKIVDGENLVDAADHAIGESFNFNLTAKVPTANLAQYTTYQMIFSDTMSAGLTFEEIKSVTVGGVTLTAEQYTFVQDTATNSFTLTVADLKKVEGTAADDQGNIVAEVVYSAHLNPNAEVTSNSGAVTTNTNTAHLVYSNDPYSDGTGTTPDSEVYVYTFNLDGTKVDGEGAPLAGAGFTLYDETGENAYSFAKVGENYYLYNADYAANYGETPEIVTEIISANETGKFVFNGLKAGTYVLKETKTPPTYNTCLPITIVISAETSKNDEGATVVTLTHTQQKQDEENPSGAQDGTAITVTNKRGSLLPSTGGIGTTIFYVVGGILVVGACVLLLVRKRVAGKN